MGNLESTFKSNFKVVIFIILIVSFLVSLLAIFISSNCELNDAQKCLIKKEFLMPDFYWHFNAIKYVSAYNSLPIEVDWLQDGGPNGDIIKEGNEKGVYHSPVFYYLGALVYSITNSLMALHVLSITLALITNILFLIFIKKISKQLNKKYTFITFSVLLFSFLPVQLFTSIIIHPSILYLPLLILSLIIYLNMTKQPALKNSIFLGILMGLAILSDLKGLVAPFVIGLFSLSLLYKKKYYKFKLFLLSLVIMTLIGSYLFIRNFFLFGSPVGFYKTNLGALVQHEFSKLLTYFGAFWGGIYGGNNFIQPVLMLAIIFLTLTTILGIFKSNLGRTLNQGLLLGIGFVTLVLGFFMTCNPDILLKSFSCAGDIIQGRYLVVLDLIIAIFSSLIFLQLKAPISLLILLTSIILFSLDFLWALV